MKTVCPECRHDIVVPAQYLGRWWRCPDCKTGFRAPAESGAGIRERVAAPVTHPVRRAISRLVSMLTGR